MTCTLKTALSVARNNSRREPVIAWAAFAIDGPSGTTYDAYRQTDLRGQFGSNLIRLAVYINGRKA